MQGTLENVNISQIRTISAERFLRYMGIGSMDDLSELQKLFSEQIL